MQNLLQSNTLFLAALILSGAILLIPLLLRLGRKQSTPGGANPARREPAGINPPPSILKPGAVKPTQQGVTPAPGVRVAHSGQAPLDTFIGCLDEALETHYREWVAPLVNSAEGTTFVLHAITVEMTATNLPLLHSVSDLKPAVLKRVFTDRLGRSSGHAHYDKSRFYGIAFRNGAEATPADGDVIRVLKTHGGERMEVTLIFQGEPDYRAPRETVHLSAAGTPITDGNAHTKATLEVTLPGEPPRTIALTHTPFRIGADPAADLFIDIPCISSTHAVLDACTGGGLSITDKSRFGTWLNGVRLAAGLPARLNARSLILFASATPSADMPLIEFRASATAPDAIDVANQGVMNANDTATVFSQAPTHAMATIHASSEGSTETVLTAQENSTPNTAIPRAAPKPRARLRVVMPDGSEADYPLTELGVDIGREPGGNGIAMPAIARQVSRRHLRLVDWAHNSGLFVENLAVERGGSYLDGQRQDAQFIWRYADAKRPNEGWLTLGEARMSHAGIRVRLLRGDGV